MQHATVFIADRLAHLDAERGIVALERRRLADERRAELAADDGGRAPQRHGKMRRFRLWLLQLSGAREVRKPQSLARQNGEPGIMAR